MAHHLSIHAVIVSFESHPAVVLQADLGAYELFKVLLDPDPKEESLKVLLQRAPSVPERALWEEWLRAYQAPDHLRQQAQEVVQATEALVAVADATIAANRRLNAWTFPLTIFGMLSGVVALGHLLTNAPKPVAASDAPRPEFLRAVVLSLVLIALLSGLDLVWTILTSQAGQLREVNPIGGRLVEDPTALISFKVGATVFALGLLYALRHRRSAQLATWWMCLVCTVLTFRWLLFNSMFVG